MRPTENTPDWFPADVDDRVEPPTEKKNTGWAPSEPLPAQSENWLLYSISLWLQHLANTRRGIVAVSDTDTSEAIVFDTALPDDTEYVVTPVWINTADASPDFQPLTVTAMSETGFTVKWNAPVTGSNYSIGYIAQELDTY